jgi:uncharacterized membrane protein
MSDIMSTKFDNQYDPNRMDPDLENYKWGIFYFNPKDQRVIVPKRNPYTGLSINFANPYSYLLLILLLAVVLFLTNIGVPHSHLPPIG